MDTNPDKLEAALEQLEAERDRRQQAQIDSGAAVLWSGPPIILGPDDDVAQALANRPTHAPDGRPFYFDPNVISVVVTGVPRGDPDEAEPQIQTASEEGNSSPPSAEPAGSGGAILSPPSQPTPTYVRIVTHNGNDDGDPGAIVEAWFTIEEGTLVLRDGDDKVITSRGLLNGDDPAVLARSLLREVEKPKDFNRPIVYPKLGFA
jgi:hypothetical protein